MRTPNPKTHTIIINHEEIYSYIPITSTPSIILNTECTIPTTINTIKKIVAMKKYVFCSLLLKKVLTEYFDSIPIKSIFVYVLQSFILTAELKSVFNIEIANTIEINNNIIEENVSFNTKPPIAMATNE